MSSDGRQAEGMMTFGEHLDALRRMVVRIVAVALVFAVAIFYFKTETFRILLAPTDNHFATYTLIERLCAAAGVEFHFEEFSVKLINTELSSQFMTHLTTSLYLALLLTSPYIVVELFRFVTPALYDNERRYSVRIAVAVYTLFTLGVMMSYFVLFPFAFRFLGTYQVDPGVVNQINLSSYISTFTTLTFMMGVVFQIPVISFFLAKMGIVDAALMGGYRRHMVILICVVAAVITPPDLLTLVLVALPMYALYEISIRLVARVTENE